MDAVALALKVLEGGIKEALSMYDISFLVSYECRKWRSKVCG